MTIKHARRAPQVPAVHHPPTSAMFSFLRLFSFRQAFIQLTGYNMNSPLFINRSYLNTADRIYQSDIGTVSQRTHICKGHDAYVVFETPEEIFRLLDS